MVIPPGPTVQNIIRPLVLAPELPRGPHHCLARRMYDTFQTPIISEPSENPTCFPTCPQHTQTVLQHPQNSDDAVLDIGQENQFHSRDWLSGASRNVSSSSRSSVSSTVSTSWAFLDSAQPTTSSSTGSHRSVSPS